MTSDEKRLLDLQVREWTAEMKRLANQMPPRKVCRARS